MAADSVGRGRFLAERRFYTFMSLAIFAEAWFGCASRLP